MCDLMKSDNDDEMLIFHQQTKFFFTKKIKIFQNCFPSKKGKHHGDPLDELSRLSILLGGVGDHPGEWKKRPSTLHFRYEHPRTAPLGSAGALSLNHGEKPGIHAR